MKKVTLLTSALLFVGLVGVQAQSGGAATGNAHQQKATGAAQKNTLSQAQGKGVPYDKEQPGNATAKKPDHNIPAPSVGTGVDAKASGKFSPGSHTAQRENKMGRKTKQIDPIPKSDKPEKRPNQ